VVSGGELLLALKAGIKPSRIVFSGVGKTDDEIELALKSKILFISAESLGELESIARIAKKLRIVAPVAVRVNPDIDPQTHPHIATGLKETKFGLSESDSKKAYGFIKNNGWLEAVGISMHIGSQVKYVAPYVDAAGKLIKLYEYLERNNIPLKFIDIGGGWAAYFSPEDDIPEPGDYVSGLSDLFSGIQATFIVEPGRSIIGSAGILITRVIALKRNGGKNYCIVDAGMNDFIRPVLYNASHRIEPLLKSTGRKIRYDIVGPVCESSDFLGKDVKLPEIKKNDYLALFTAGAYGSSMGSNYNSRPRPTEIAVANKNIMVIRERETLKDLMKNQRLKSITRLMIVDLKKDMVL
jgi:diaminopimelate decarboxylase